MKKLISVFLLCAISVLLAVPCFAANTARFNINVVSESNREIKISIDYEGGTAFACYDFEMEYNTEKLTVSSAIEGNGWDSFAKNTKMNGGAVISTVNSNDYPIKGTCATTEPFKVINGKDLVVVTFTKQAKEKIEASDISLKFTNCQTSDFQNIKASITNSLAAASDTDVSSSAEKKTEEKNTAKTDKAESSDNSIPSLEEQIDDTENTVSENETVSELTEKNGENSSGNSKKIVVVAAAAVCMLFIIVGVCAYVAKKAKNDVE